MRDGRQALIPPKLTSTQDQRAGYVRESRRNRLERGPVILTMKLAKLAYT